MARLAAPQRGGPAAEHDDLDARTGNCIRQAWVTSLYRQHSISPRLASLDTVSNAGCTAWRVPTCRDSVLTCLNGILHDALCRQMYGFDLEAAPQRLP